MLERWYGTQALQARRGARGRGVGAGGAGGEASEAGDASRTPEDSVCSNEGPSHYTDADQQAWSAPRPHHTRRAPHAHHACRDVYL